MLLLLACTGTAPPPIEPPVETPAPSAPPGALVVNVAPDGTVRLAGPGLELHFVGEEEALVAVDGWYARTSLSSLPSLTGAALRAGQLKLALADGRALIQDADGLWLEDGTRRLSIEDPEGAVSSGAIVPLPDERHATSLLVGPVYRWEELPTSRPLWKVDLGNGRAEPRALVPAFEEGRASPSGRFVSFEYGDEESSYTNLYDVAGDRVIGPLFDKANVESLAWLGERLLVAELEVEELEVVSGRWSLVDPAGPARIWSVPQPFSVFATDVHPLPAGGAWVVDRSACLHRLDAQTGALVPLEGLRGRPIALSPQGDRVALVTLHEEGNARGPTSVRVCALDGSACRELLTLPHFAFQKAYKGMDARAPSWSPSGGHLALHGEGEVLVLAVPP